MRFESTTVPKQVIDIINKNITSIERWALERTNVEFKKDNPEAVDEEIDKLVKRAERSKRRVVRPRVRRGVDIQELMQRAKTILG